MLGNYGNIANTQVADIAGALDIRQKKLDADEAKRKEIRTNQLIADAIPGLRADSPAHKLAMEDPAKFAFLAKTAGIPLNAGDQFQAMVDDTHAIAKLATNDPEGAIQYASTLSEQRKQLGADTTKLDSWLQLAQQDSGKAIRAMQMADKTFNDDIYRKRDLEDREMAQKDRSLDIQEKRITADRTVAGQGTADQKNWDQYQQLLKTDPAAAEKFAKATGFASTEGEKLSAFAEKEISKSSDAYTDAKSSAGRYRSLADKLETSALKGGVKGAWGEWVKEQTGNQDELTALRKEALSISNSEAINNLPPGPATDRDIEIAKAPFPTEKADPKYVAKWLRAVSNLRDKEAEFNEFKADFISKNGTVRGKGGVSLAAAWKESQKSSQPSQDDSSTKETAAQRYARLKASMSNGN